MPVKRNEVNLAAEREIGIEKTSPHIIGWTKDSAEYICTTTFLLKQTLNKYTCFHMHMLHM